MTTQEIITQYGTPNITGIPYLTTIQLPYPMRLAWDLETEVKTMRCHSLVEDNFINVFNDILYYYGKEYIQEFGIDLFGGCFNYRPMRSGTNYSTHSWGISIDLDPARNGLRTPWKDCQFSKREYEPMIDIFYANGFVNLGVEKNYDGMHFEIKE